MSRPGRRHPRASAWVATVLVALALAPAVADGRPDLARSLVRGVGARARAFDLAGRRLQILSSDREPGILRGARGQLEQTPLKASTVVTSRDQYGYFAARAARAAEQALATAQRATELNLAPPLVELERSLALATVAETFQRRARSPHEPALEDVQSAVVDRLDQEILTASFHGEVQRADRLIELISAHVGPGQPQGFSHQVRSLLEKAVEARLELAEWGTARRPGIVVPAARRPPRFAAIEGPDADARDLASVRAGLDKLESLGGSTAGLRDRVAEAARRP